MICPIDLHPLYPKLYKNLSYEIFAVKLSLDGYSNALFGDQGRSSVHPSLCNLVAAAAKSSVGFS
jgi:hypothetical protein